MKITIEGEPKEIAALELALKDGSPDNRKCVKFSVPTGIKYHVDGGNAGTNGIGPAAIQVFKN